VGGIVVIDLNSGSVENFAGLADGHGLMVSGVVVSPKAQAALDSIAWIAA
jgi:hypothetical protein